MITTKDLESLGWKYGATAKNGGSKVFYKGEYSIYSHSDNFIMKSRNSPEYYEITINKFMSPKSTEIWIGIPKDIQDLKRILVETGADMEWLPELRDEKINDILNEKTL
jgi:hypothetical protein